MAWLLLPHMLAAGPLQNLHGLMKGWVCWSVYNGYAGLLTLGLLVYSYWFYSVMLPVMILLSECKACVISVIHMAGALDTCGDAHLALVPLS